MDFENRRKILVEVNPSSYTIDHAMSSTLEHGYEVTQKIKRGRE